MAVSIRNLIRFGFVAITVFYLLDAGVEASRAGRKHRHRSKRTHGDKPRKARKSLKKHAKLPIQIVESHGDPVRTQSASSFTTTSSFTIPSKYYQKLLRKNKPDDAAIETDDSTDVLSVVKANVDFFVKHEPELTTDIDEFDSIDFELDYIHKSSGVYGIHSQPDTVYGQVIHIEDAGRRDSHFGCGNAVANARNIPRDRAPWIALMARGHCSFFYKVKLAQRNNASAVLIYNDRPGDPPEMFTLGTWIPSVAIARHDGHKVAQFTSKGKKVMAKISIAPEATSTITAPRAKNMIARTTTHSGAITHKDAFFTTFISTAVAIVFHLAS